VQPKAQPLRPAVPPALRLSDAAACAGLRPSAIPAAWDQVVLTGVTLDSRTVRPGELYAALPGASAHGADFAGQAVAAGASAVLTDPAGEQRLRRSGQADGIPVIFVPDPRGVLGAVAAAVQGHPGSDLLLLGVTGTNGKTTTAYLLDSALRALGRTTGLLGTVETRIAGERWPSVRTTPESTDVHALLAVMRERGVEACTMEVSSHALALHRVDGLVFDVAGFTNLSQDHLDFHGTMEQYYAAKAELFTPLRSRRGVVCVDDAWGERLARAASVPVETVASAADVGADWWLDPAAPGDPAFMLRSSSGGPVLALRSALPGEFNRVNTALAAVMLLACDIPATAVATALRADPHVPGRMERVDAGLPGQPLAIVDFAHTAEAVASALSALRSLTTGRLVVVLGAGGDRDRGKRPQMGRAAFEHADAVVITDDNPRSEDPAAIRAELLAGMPAGVAAGMPAGVAAGTPAGTSAPGEGVVLEVAGRAEAIRRAVGLTQGPQDTVVVVGKGHETGQEVAGVVHPFEDRAELRAALDERRLDLLPRAEPAS